MLAIQDLSCIRGDHLLFKNLSFDVKSGSLLYVLGENGSGKSSLLRLVCGLLSQEEGAVLWRGDDIRHVRESYQADLLYIGHLNGLKDDLTALENLHMNARLAGEDASLPQALDALKAMGLGRIASLPARVLSQGQKRRVALARIWLTKAKLWVLDEPFAALDASTIDLLAAQLGQHLANHGMIILTTHQEVTILAENTQMLRLSH
ncbi:MAG: cytochrome c biogenesis heme-transporting ATPase CcmA [Methylophilaceae bacterium]|nr:cytochrome c biogenesis heme-transporting ATPase CcmA [Methylophilaceae bacterium]